VYGFDTTAFGQAYFFINPFAKRDLVIEVPHEGFETGTGPQGAQLFKTLAARALILNKEHRCSDPDPSSCSAATQVCNGAFRESDVAHHAANVFYLLHARYTDRAPGTRFVQLHGFTSAANDIAEIGDGTTGDLVPGSVANVFASALRARVPVPTAVHSCQEASGDPPSGLCGETNVEARYTHQPSSAECPAAAGTSSGRFLHIEQGLTLRDEDDGDGWSRADVADALVATWPECTLNGGTSCSLGRAHTQEEPLTCPPQLHSASGTRWTRSGARSAVRTFSSSP
jgi:rubredoxin